MFNNTIKNLSLIITSILIIDFQPVNAKCYSETCLGEKKFAKNKLFEKKSYNFVSYKNYDLEKSYKGENIEVNLRRIIQKDKFNLNQIFNNLLITNKDTIENKSNRISTEIKSDIQYSENNIFYAEGNVEVILENGILNADKVSYDRENKKFKVHSKFSIKKGDQFLEASYLEYNFSAEKGFIDNAYGILDLKKIKNDLKFETSLYEKKSCEFENKKLIDLPTEIGLLDSTNERFKKEIGFIPFRFNLANVTNWRFKAQKIILEENKLISEVIYFTNDPYNEPQLIIKSKDFSAELIDNKTRFKSSSTFLTLDNKLTLPLGNKTISDNNANIRWGIGYSDADKDGLYIMRNSDTIALGGNFDLDIKPYFLVQRAIKGNSKVFREIDSSVLSDNVKNEIGYLDYIALNSKISGSLYDWNLNIDTEFRSLNPNKLYDGISSDINLVRNIYSYSNFENDLSDNYCGNNLDTNKSVSNFSSDFGFYGIYDKDDIYTGYGTKLVNNFEYKNKKVSKNYSLIFDIGEFQGPSLIDNKDLIGLTRYGITSSFLHNYRLSVFNEEALIFDKTFKNISQIVDQGLYFKSKVSTGLYQYNDGSSQSIFSISAGPELVFGKFKNRFFDYTELFIIPELIIKNSKSPFKFDDFNNNSRVIFGIRQQLIGPIILSFNGNLNINNSSNSYGNIENKRFSVGLSRRSYSINLSYLEDDKSFLLGFEIFNIGKVTGNSKRF